MTKRWRVLLSSFRSRRQNSTFRTTPVLALVLTWGLALAPASQDASSLIRSELQRIQQSLDKKPDSDPDWKEAKPDIRADLEQARAALDAGRLYLAVETLEKARYLFRAYEAAESLPKDEAKQMDAFQAEWEKTGLELTALERTAQGREWSNAPAVVRALSETAQGQMMALLQASRAYAMATKPQWGVANLGQAKAAAEFSTFCYSLNLARHGTALPLRSILPELQRLQERVTAAFQPPRSIDQHNNFIALNSTLKLAGELDATKLYAGALYEYLKAVRQFGALDAVAPDAAKHAQLQQTLAALGARLRSSGRDDSMAQIFLEQAQTSAAGGGSASEPVDWRKIGIILDQVLPAYFSVLDRAAPELQKAGGTITVTLVRWPYT